MSPRHPLLPERAALEAAHATIAKEVTTPQYRWPLLAERTGAEVWVKHENYTPTGAFKIRGGLFYMARLKEAEPGVRGVVTATTGNHGQSIALAARRFGLRAVIVVPHGNSPTKNAAMRSFGAELIEHGRDFQDAFEHACGMAEDARLHLVPSFHRWLVEGVATYAYEFFRATPPLDAVYVPIGLGSGICGTIAAREALGLKTEIVGVVAEGADCYALSFEQRRPVSTNAIHTFAAGLAVRVPNEEALGVMLSGVARIVRVSDAAMEAAIGHYLIDCHTLAEPAGAAPLAALLKEREAMKEKRVGLILSGGNIDPGDLVRAVLAYGPSEVSRDPSVHEAIGQHDRS
jgi:threonine dehydratase